MLKNKDKKANRYDQYNLDRLDSLVTVALIADQKVIRVPKRIYKLAKQFLKMQGIRDIDVKTY